MLMFFDETLGVMLIYQTSGNAASAEARVSVSQSGQVALLMVIFR